MKAANILIGQQVYIVATCTIEDLNCCCFQYYVLHLHVYFITLQRHLEAAQFLQNIVYINQPMSDVEKVQTHAGGGGRGSM